MSDKAKLTNASPDHSPSKISNGPAMNSERHNSYSRQSSNVSGGPVKDSVQKPRSSSFKDSDKYARTKSGTFVRMDSDLHDSGAMPDFRAAIKQRLAKTRDQLPQGLMREVLETYKPHILGRRRQLVEDCVRDLRLNNDHIHIVEQEMRRAIQASVITTIIILQSNHCPYKECLYNSNVYLGIKCIFFSLHM